MNVNALLKLVPQPRRSIIMYLAEHGSVQIETVAAFLGITVSGARQHMAALERDGAVTFVRRGQGPGRPRHLYSLSTELAGDE